MVIEPAMSATELKGCDVAATHSGASTDGEVSECEADGEMSPLRVEIQSASSDAKFGIETSPSSTQAPTPVPTNQHDSQAATSFELESVVQDFSPNVEWEQDSTSSDCDSVNTRRQSPCMEDVALANTGSPPSVILDEASELDSEVEDLRPTLRGRGPHRFCPSKQHVVRSPSRSKKRSRTPLSRMRNLEDDAQTTINGMARESEQETEKVDAATLWIRRKRANRKKAKIDSARQLPVVSRSVKLSPSREDIGSDDDEQVDESRQREVYVGNIPYGVVAKDVAEAIEDLFDALPEFHERYPLSSRPPILCSRGRNPPRKLQKERYAFLKFADAMLASTAVAMTGLKVGGRSVRISRPSDVAVTDVFPSPMDVGALRENLLLPYSYSPGTMMFDEVFIGSGCRGVCAEEEQIVSIITESLLGLESVRQRFPGLTKVVDDVRICDGGKYAFIMLVNEVLASTLVAMGEVALPKGRVRVDWTQAIAQDGQRKPAPSLNVHMPPHLTNSIGLSDTTHYRSKEADSSQCLVADRVQDSSKEHSQACSVYVGDMGGLEAGILWDAFKTLFQSLPSYKVAYPGGEEPVLKVRVGGVGTRRYCFVQLRSAALASTAVKIAKLEVAGRTLRLCRPANFRPPAEGYHPALELEDESFSETSDSSIKESEDSSSSESNDEGPQCFANQLVIVPTPMQAWFSIPQLTLPPPPPAPSQPKSAATLWIGNLPFCGADSGMLEAFLTHRYFEACRTNQLFQVPLLDLTNGPPVKSVIIHPSKRYAFAKIRDARLGYHLIPVFNRCKYFGRHLRVAVSRYPDYTCDNDDKQISKNGQAGEEEREFCDLGEALANLDMAEL